eukprot:536096_1
MNHGILDIDKYNNKGFNALFVASQNGHSFIVKLLLQNGADPNSTSYQGVSPLNMAAEEGHLEVVRVLLSHSDTDIDYQDLEGVTPLYIACQQNDIEIVKLLLHPTNIINDEKEDTKQP